MRPLKSTQDDIIELSDKRLALAEQYMADMQELGRVSSELKVILATKIKSYQEQKKNIGEFTAELYHINESGQGIRDDYKRRDLLHNKCKATIVLIEALRDKMIALQSIEKNNKNII